MLELRDSDITLMTGMGGRLNRGLGADQRFRKDVRGLLRVGQPAAGAAGLVELLFVRLDLAVDEVESLLRGTG